MTSLTAIGGRGALRRRPVSALARRRQRVGLLFVAPAVLMVLAFFIAPLVLMVWMSLNDWPLLGTPTFVGTRNYTDALHDPTFRHSLLFTGKYTLLLTPILMIVGFALAVLVQTPRRGVGIFRTIYFMPYIVGFAAASYLFLQLFNSGTGVIDRMLTDLHLVNHPVQWFASPKVALAAVLVVVTWKTAGFCMLLIMSGLQSVSGEVVEAAHMDGSGWWSTMFRVQLPLIKQTLGLVLIFSIAGSVLAFDQFYILTNGGPSNQTLTAVYWIYNQGFTHFQLGYASALSLVLMVIVAAISGIQLRLFRDTNEV